MATFVIADVRARVCVCMYVVVCVCFCVSVTYGVDRFISSENAFIPKASSSFVERQKQSPALSDVFIALRFNVVFLGPVTSYRRAQ